MVLAACGVCPDTGLRCEGGGTNRTGAERRYIAPGKLVQIAFVESFDSVPRT